MPLPPVQCSYSVGRPSYATYHRKVWLNVGTTKRLFEIGLLENFIHYGLGMRVTPEDAERLHLPSNRVGWALPYTSPKSELPDGPGILPTSLRRGLIDILPRLHQRGFLIFHDESLKTRPTRIGTQNITMWHRMVMNHGDWRLTPMARHLFTAAKAWLGEQPLFADSGTLPCFNLNDDPLPRDIIDRILVHCVSMGVGAKVIANTPLPPGKPGITGPHLLFEHEPRPSTYWLKQEDRAQDHLLEGVWKILEASKAGTICP